MAMTIEGIEGLLKTLDDRTRRLDQLHADLLVRVSELERRVTAIEKRRPAPTAAPSPDDLGAVVARLIADGPQPRTVLIAEHGRAVIDALLSTGDLLAGWHNGVPHLFVAGTGDSLPTGTDVGNLVAYLQAEGPQTLAALRDRFNKNTLPRTIANARSQGRIIEGQVISTGGRPRKAVALAPATPADREALPTVLEHQPVVWDIDGAPVPLLEPVTPSGDTPAEEGDDGGV